MGRALKTSDSELEVGLACDLVTPGLSNVVTKKKEEERRRRKKEKKKSHKIIGVPTLVKLVVMYH